MARAEGGTEDAAEQRDDELVGRAIGKYTLARVIGRGGMGIVYEAQNTSIGKRVAIKLVSSELAKNKDAVKRFQREAQAASAVESAHIVDIFDAGVSDEGVPYIVMELLRGEDLGHRIRRLGRLELEDALHVTVQILRGLARAHAAGIVHRDLKPDNVFLVDRDDDDSFVKVLDFGISKVARHGEAPVQTLTKQGTVLGTPFYMSPEQAQGLPDTDGRADLWSTGAILYECLTGRAPHTGGSYEAVIVSICSKDAPDVRMHNPAVPETIAKVISKALARDRDERFATAREMSDALVAASGGLMTAGPRSSDDPSDPFPSGRMAAHSPSGSAKAHSGPGMRLTPARISGEGAAYEETVEMLKGGGPSRVGWSTSSGSTVGRNRRRKLAVVLGGLALAAVVTIAFALQKPGDPPQAHAVPPPPPPAGDVSVQLRSNVETARFMVDGKPLTNGLLRGAKGETKKVTVEAEGYVSLEAIVALEPDLRPPELTLSPKTEPEVAALPTAKEADSATPRSGKSALPKATATASSKATSAPTALVTALPATTQTAAPASTPTLTIKRD
ncbi:MAG: protein kinase [Polyangiaceae bacterium]